MTRRLPTPDNRRRGHLDPWTGSCGAPRERRCSPAMSERELPPITGRRLTKPIVSHATGLCLRTVGKRAIGRECGRRNRLCPYRRLRDRRRGAGHGVEFGWSKDPNARRLERRAGQRDHRPRQPDAHAAGGGDRAGGLEAEQVRTSPRRARSPNNHRGYAATWFLLALDALIIYGLALRKRWQAGRAP